MRAIALFAIGVAVVAVTGVQAVNAGCYGPAAAACFMRCAAEGRPCNFDTCDCQYTGDSFKSLYRMFPDPPKSKNAEGDQSALGKQGGGHDVTGCDGLRRLTCHIQCTKQGTQCNVHTCECYHYKSLYMMLRVPVQPKLENAVADSGKSASANDIHDDVDVVLLNDI